MKVERIFNPEPPDCSLCWHRAEIRLIADEPPKATTRHIASKPDLHLCVYCYIEISRSLVKLT